MSINTHVKLFEYFCSLHKTHKTDKLLLADENRRGQVKLSFHNHHHGQIMLLPHKNHTNKNSTTMHSQPKTRDPKRRHRQFHPPSLCLFMLQKLAGTAEEWGASRVDWEDNLLGDPKCWRIFGKLCVSLRPWPRLVYTKIILINRDVLFRGWMEVNGETHFCQIQEKDKEKDTVLV